MKHLITGGSGFLGNLIARRLHARGERVRTLDVWEDPSCPREIEFVRCDIRDRAGVAQALRGVDVVHHNVALVPLTKAGKDFWSVNVEGSRIAAEEAAKARVKTFIHVARARFFILEMGSEGFEPSKALPSDLQSDPFDHSGNPPSGLHDELAEGLEPTTC